MFLIYTIIFIISIIIGFTLFYFIINRFHYFDGSKYKFNIPVYLVSMEKDIERRNNLNIYPDYYKSINGAELEYIPENTSNKLKRGEIGCYLSHLHLLNYAIDNNPGSKVLILEDDAFILPETERAIDFLTESAPEDWEVLFLGHNYYELIDTTIHKIGGFQLKPVKKVHGCQSYLINTKNVTKEKIAKLMPMDMPYDLKLPLVLKSYIVEPKMVELSSFSMHSNTQSIV